MLSVRARLVTGTLLLILIGLTVAALITYRLVESALVDDLDEKLVESQVDVLRELAGEEPRFPSGPGRGRLNFFIAVTPGTYGELRAPNDEIVGQVSSPVDGVEIPPPALDQHIEIGRRVSKFVNVSGTDGGPSYRAYIHSFEGGGMVIVARPLTDVNHTLDRLLVIEFGVGVGVLAIAGLLSLFVVRIGLRPLNRVVATADAIADGDLTQRVPISNPKTEVGHLGSAFNAMVESIEESVRRREASELKLRAFMSDASHELRTPLTSLRGYSEMLGRGDLNAEDREVARRRLQEAADRMSGLVDDTLMLARLDEGPEPSTERLDLSELSKGAVDDALAADPLHPIEAGIEESIHVHGNSDRLARVLSNLLRNFQIHTADGTSGGIRLRRDGETAVIEVWDRGPGLSPDSREHIFERFYRVDKSRARERGGSGLGLAIAATIVNSHGGTITVQGNPGGGALFRVVLPFAEGSPA